jgi:hypothetical protein
MRVSRIMGVEAAVHTHFPATQDSSKAVANSHRCNPQSEPKSDFGQVQTHKVTPETLALLTFQQGTITKEREKYAARSNNYGSAVGPRNFFASAGYHVDLCWAAPSKRTQ